jgi:thioredoxin 1
MSKIQKINTKDQYEELVKSKISVIYFTILEAQDDFTKQILDTMYKEFEEFTENSEFSAETKFAVVDLQKSEDLAEELKCRALSSFHGFIGDKLVSKTGQTKDITDLTELMEELKNPEKILPHKVTSQDDFDKILKENELVVCDFTASWCGPCQMIGPKFKALAKKQQKEGKNSLGGDKLVKFIKVEQTENKEIVEKAGVSCYPSFYMYKNGEKVENLVTEGADDEKLAFNIKKLIDENYEEIHHAEFVDTEDKFNQIIKEKDIVFVDFTASWCPPCKMIKPIYEELAETHKDKTTVKFVKIDVDENEEVSQTYSIRSMPTFKVFKAGKEVEEDGFGGASVDKLKTMVEKYTKDL